MPLMRGATNKSLNTERLGQLEIPLLESSSQQGKAIQRLLEQKRKIEEAESELKELRLKHHAGIEALKEICAFQG